MLRAGVAVTIFAAAPHAPDRGVSEECNGLAPFGQPHTMGKSKNTHTGLWVALPKSPSTGDASASFAQKDFRS